MAYLETRLAASQSEQLHEKELRQRKMARLARGGIDLVESSKDGRDEFISTVREFISERQWTEITPELADDLIEKVQSIENTPGEIFKKLDIGGESTWVSRKRMGNPFASPKLGALMGYIGVYNEQHHTSWTLLDAFIAGYGGEANVAGMLSLARLSCIYGGEARQMDEELFDMWLERGWIIGHVLDIQKKQLHIIRRPWAYTVKDPLKQYILYFTRALSLPELYTANILELLNREKFNIKELLSVVEESDEQITDFLIGP